MTSEELIAWRNVKQLTQADVSTLLEVSRQTVINWERGHHPIPSTLSLKLLAIEVRPAEDTTARQRPMRRTLWQHMTLEQKAETYAIVQSLCERRPREQDLTPQEHVAWHTFPQSLMRLRMEDATFYALMPPELTHITKT